MKKLAVILSAVILLNLSSCVTLPATPSSVLLSSSESATFTIEEIAEAGKARIGEFQHSYYLSPTININFESVTFYTFFNSGEEKALENVICAEVVTDFEELKTFLADKATLVLVDDEGNTITDVWTVAYKDKTGERLYIIAGSDNLNISSYNYFVLGGFNPEKNEGSNRLFYEVSKNLFHSDNEINSLIEKFNALSSNSIEPPNKEVFPYQIFVPCNGVYIRISNSTGISIGLDDNSNDVTNIKSIFHTFVKCLDAELSDTDIEVLWQEISAKQYSRYQPFVKNNLEFSYYADAVGDGSIRYKIGIYI